MCALRAFRPTVPDILRDMISVGEGGGWDIKPMIGLSKYVYMALAILAAGVLFLIATTSKNPLHVYLIPENFVGEINIVFEQAAYPPLDKEKNSYIYRVPKSGKLQTSSKMESGPVEVYYVDEHGNRTKIGHDRFHGVSAGSGSEQSGSVATLFIRTKEQYEIHVKRQ